MISKQFATAGNATFTIEPSQEFLAQNGDCKPHYTYKIRHKEAANGYPEAWFVNLLTGPDNESSYSYLGMLDAKAGMVKLTKKSRFGEQAHPVAILRRALKRIWAGEGAMIEAAGWKVHHEGCCGRCGRTLTVPASIESGFGPECVKFVNGESRESREAEAARKARLEELERKEQEEAAAMQWEFEQEEARRIGDSRRLGGLAEMALAELEAERAAFERDERAAFDRNAVEFQLVDI